MDYITLILAELGDKKKYIAIMDDLLIHSTKVAHWKLLVQLLKFMCKNGLRLSPKKWQLFKTQLTYIRNEFSINKRTMTIIPLRSRTEAINKIPTPKTPKQCKSFCGAVNYLSLFCPDLQKLLKPIVEIMKAKTEAATTRIMRLLDRLSAYSFNLYYVKDRDMILSDYLSRHRQKDLDLVS